jgi:hypothetical protein
LDVNATWTLKTQLKINQPWIPFSQDCGHGDVLTVPAGSVIQPDGLGFYSNVGRFKVAGRWLNLHRDQVEFTLH